MSVVTTANFPQNQVQNNKHNLQRNAMVDVFNVDEELFYNLPFL
jgi:hypothetical protein